MSIKDAKLDFIVSIAKDLFLKNGVSVVTIKDIAVEAGVGEATIYRYFSKKQNIVVAVALKLEEEILKKFFKLSKADTGYEKLSLFYNRFLEIFEKRKDYLKFISEFDSYFSNEKANLEDYEKGINSFYNVYIEAYNLGLEDKTIKEIENINLFYQTTTHSLMGLCKKLAYEHEILNQDSKILPKDEIICLINIILFNLKNL